MHLAVQVVNDHITTLMVQFLKEDERTPEFKQSFLDTPDRWGYTCLDTAYDVGNSLGVRLLEQMGAIRRKDFAFNSGLTIVNKNNDSTELNELLPLLESKDTRKGTSVRGSNTKKSLNVTNLSSVNDIKQEVNKTIQVLNAVHANDLNSIIRFKIIG